jgi:hypothetical protein
MLGPWLLDLLFMSMGGMVMPRMSIPPISSPDAPAAVGIAMPSASHTK